MRLFDRRGVHARRNWRPSLEGLETRALLSVAASSVGPVNPALIPGFVSKLYPTTTTTTTTTVITTPDNAAGQIGQTATSTNPPGTYSVPQPSAAEIKRQEFVVTFNARYFVGAPRFSNQSSTIHIYSDGKNATSNQFLHGRAQIILFPPADPTAQPTVADPVAGQTEGLAVVFSSNFLQSSDAEFLDLSTPAGTAANDPSITDHGMPSHLTFTLDTVGSGFYTADAYATTPATTQTTTSGQSIPLATGATGSVNYSAGTGVVDITYHPSHKRVAGALGSGTCTVTIQGLINFPDIFNALSPEIN